MYLRNALNHYSLVATKKYFSKKICTFIDLSNKKHNNNNINALEKILFYKNRMAEMQDKMIDNQHAPDFPHLCLYTNLNYIDLLRNFDCLGISVDFKRTKWVNVSKIHYTSLRSINTFVVEYFQKESRENAVIPLFINEFNWKNAEYILQTLYGYFTTRLNSDGMSEIIMMYFSMLEKTIYDRIEKPESEMVGIIHEQIRLCCASFNEVSPFCITIHEFITHRSKRIEYTMPELNLFLVSIYFNQKRKRAALQAIDEFEYVLFEEVMRRRLLDSELSIMFLGKNLFSLFQFDFKSIRLAAKRLSELNYFDNDPSIIAILKLNGHEFVEYVFEKTKISLHKLDTDNEDYVSSATAEKYKHFFQSFANSNVSQLFNFVFGVGTFFQHYSNVCVPFIHQIVKYGMDYKQWTVFEKYKRFEDCNGKEYLFDEYMASMKEIFIQYFKDATKEIFKKSKSDDFPLTRNLSKTVRFVCGSFKPVLNRLQSGVDGVNIEHILYFLDSTYLSSDCMQKWHASGKHLFRLFSVVYNLEKKKNILKSDNPAICCATNESKLNDAIHRFPASWEILSRQIENVWRRKYIFSRYRFEFDSNVIEPQTLLFYKDYIDHVEFLTSETFQTFLYSQQEVVQK